MTIWEYPLVVTDAQVLTIPKGAQIVAVQVQGNSPCLWAIVDQSEETERRVIRTFGTGHEILPSFLKFGTYLGTYRIASGSLVFHVFDYGVNHD